MLRTSRPNFDHNIDDKTCLLNVHERKTGWKNMRLVVPIGNATQTSIQNMLTEISGSFKNR